MHCDKLAFALAALTFASCSDDTTGMVVNNVLFTAHDDNQQPTRGVLVRVNDKELGRTDATGDLSMRMTGSPGASFSVQAICPAPYQSPKDLPKLILNPIAPVVRRDANLVIGILCERPTRDVAILVRALVNPRPPLGRRHSRRHPKVLPARPLAHLPLLHKGEPVAHTDSNGLAHLTLSTRPAELIELVADTTGSSFATLRPRSPTLTVEVKADDNIYVLEPTFSDDLPPPAPSAPPRPKHFIKFYAGGSAPLMELSKTGDARARARR